MEFKVNQQEFIRELNLALGSVEKRVTIPMLGNVLLTAEGDSLQIETTDLQVRYRATIPAKVKKSGVFTLPMLKLHGAVTGNQGEESEVSFKVGANDWATLAWERNKTRIAGVAATDYPRLNEEELFNTFTLNTGQLSYLIERVAETTDDDPVKTNFNGANFQVTEAGVTATSTDRTGLGYAAVACENDIEPFSFFLPNRGLFELKKVLASAPIEAPYPLKVSVGRNYASFQWSNKTLYAQLMDGKFPNCAPVLNQSFPKSALIPAVSLKEVLGRVGRFADSLSRAVHLTFSKDGLCVMAATSLDGSSEETLDTNYQEDEEVTIKINQQYLASFLKLAGNNPVKVAFKGSESATEWTVDLDPGFRFLVMPMMATPLSPVKS